MSRNNSCATYDLSCILAENLFCYLLYNGEFISCIVYNTRCCEELKSPLFVKCLNWWSIIYIDVYLHFSGRIHYQTTITHKFDGHVCCYYSVYQHFILFYSGMPHRRFSRISFFLSLRTSVSSCQLTYPRSKNNLLLVTKN